MGRARVETMRQVASTEPHRNRGSAGDRLPRAGLQACWPHWCRVRSTGWRILLLDGPGRGTVGGRPENPWSLLIHAVRNGHLARRERTSPSSGRDGRRSTRAKSPTVGRATTLTRTPAMRTIRITAGARSASPRCSSACSAGVRTRAHCWPRTAVVVTSMVPTKGEWTPSAPWEAVLRSSVGNGRITMLKIRRNIPPTSCWSWPTTCSSSWCWPHQKLPMTAMRRPKARNWARWCRYGDSLPPESRAFPSH